MSAYVLTLPQLRGIMWDVTKAITSFPDNQILHAFQPNGQPGFEITQNLIYLNVSPQDDPNDKQQYTLYGPGDNLNATGATTYTTVFSVDFTLYGPNSYDNAVMIKSRILNDDIREIMTNQLVFPVADIPAPRYAPYDFNDQYYNRTDLTVTIYVGSIRTASVPYLQSAAIISIPDVGPQIPFFVEPGGTLPGSGLDFSDPGNSEYIPLT